MSTSAFPVTDLTADETVTLARTGYVTFKSILASNSNTVQVFIQLFNAAATGDVNLGTTAPDYVFKIPAGVTDDDGAFENFFDGLVFGKGLVYAVTTTASGSGAPSSSIVFSYGIV